MAAHPRSPPKSRNWCFTLNNPTDDQIKAIEVWHAANSTAYIIYGKEKGDSGTPHLQGYLHLKSPQALSFLKKISPQAHWEKCKGTPEENIAYCSKEGDITVFGSVPQTQQDANKAQQKRFIELSKKGDFDTIEAEMPGKFLQQYRTMRQLSTDYMVKPPDLEKPCGIWIYGDTGCGKTTAARTEYGEYYTKMCNKWWCGYQGEKTVIMEDMDPAHSKLAHHVKLWADKWSFLAEVKGSTRQIRPQNFIITSNHTIDEVFWDSKDSDLAAIKRRFKVIHMHKRVGPPPSPATADQPTNLGKRLTYTSPIIIDDCDDEEAMDDSEDDLVITPGKRRMFMDLKN